MSGTHNMLSDKFSFYFLCGLRPRFYVKYCVWCESVFEGRWCFLLVGEFK